MRRHARASATPSPDVAGTARPSAMRTATRPAPHAITRRARTMARPLVGRTLAALLAVVCLAACGRAIGRRPLPTAERPDGLAASADSSWQNQPVSQPEEILAGRFPGVTVLQSPAGIRLRIRGSTSLNGTNEPLFIVDGVPLPTGNGGLIGISARDIANIQVLKSAGELAEYGVRGANGVVKVTTRRGGS